MYTSMYKRAITTPGRPLPNRSKAFTMSIGLHNSASHLVFKRIMQRALGQLKRHFKAPRYKEFAKIAPGT